ncbi:MAG: LytR C-terminal domain-containing protein [Firmicutes bacterium]|nr:LytR C-terminal domain-containing protein [Bacillota bacterium]
MPGYYTVKTKRRRLKKGRLLFLLAICGFLLLLFFTSRFLGTLHDMQDRSAWSKDLPTPAQDEHYHVLIYTLSQKEEAPLITGLYLVSTKAQAEKKDVHAIQVPVDTLLNADGDNATSLAKALSSGDREFLVDSITTLSGTDVHAFLEIDEDKLVNVVDEMGITFPETITVTNDGDLTTYINDDEQSALQQLERRRQILTSLTNHILEGNFFSEVIQFRKASPLLATNLAWRDLLAVFKTYEDSSFEEIVQIHSLPGSVDVRTDGDFWVADTNSLPALLTWLDSEGSTMPREQITVEVLNGNGTVGIASHVAELLTNEGFSVIRVGNADHYDYERSQVISRTNDVGPAKDVAILVPQAELLKSEETDIAVVVTVIVGKNYTSNE